MTIITMITLANSRDAIYSVLIMKTWASLQTKLAVIAVVEFFRIRRDGFVYVHADLAISKLNLFGSYCDCICIFICFPYLQLLSEELTAVRRFIAHFEAAFLLPKPKLFILYTCVMCINKFKPTLR
mmetsp:Transcript_9274/g.13954  ORF Transcript_9274/g.13954 Transcript_9274/m.13954 type:complete len:126 (+) Transcript_9274:350-727(+)